DTFLKTLRMRTDYLFLFACLLDSFHGVHSAEYFCSETCVVDLATATPTANNGTTCSYSCPSGGSMTNPCTSTTSTTTTTTTTTTSPSTTTTTEPSTTTGDAVIDGPCASIVKDDGILYDNKCVIIDTKANCHENSLPTCVCSEGYSGSTCGIKSEQLIELGKLIGGGENATEQAQQIIKEIEASKGSGGSATIIANLPSLLSFLTDEQRIGMSYTAGEVIMVATYEGKKLDVNTDFTRVTDPSLGNCFTFNHHNASHKYKIRRIGAGGGLRVELDSLPSEYAPWTDIVGMSVYVHPIGLELNVESSKYASVPGSADQIVLTRSMFHKIGKKCARDTRDAQSFYMDGKYSVDGCLRACYQDSVQRECGCMDASYARKDGVDGCRFGKLPCITSMAASRGDPVAWKECHCPPPCDEETYDYLVSRATHLRVDNANFTQRRSEVILYFDSFHTSVSQEEYKMTLSEFIGYVGGIGGLLLGITISFIVEVFLLAFILFGCCGSKEKTKSS
ncbi:hypothetical protein PMAYCL1PPCAC_15886, partial [Pristionchus mayeri]